jgi:hypothetical protein
MPVGPAAHVLTILHAKSAYVEHARAMGQRNRGPWDPERSHKMRETLSVLNAMSAEARRHYHAERKSRWLTNCIVERGDIKTFDLAGVLNGQAYNIHIEMPLDVTLLDFLLLVMRYEDTAMTMRLDCAKNAATLMHEKPRRRAVIEDGRRSSLVAGGHADPADPDR